MTDKSNKIKPIVLVILDGWGLSPSWGGNAIAMSNPPFINSLWRDYPHLILQAFRKLAGPTGKVASSEIGHSSIGCGRLIYQDLARINESIKDKSFFANQVLLDTCSRVKKNNSSLHIMGLVSDGAIHSHVDHLVALLQTAKEQKVEKVYIHAFLDGIDAPSTSALIFLTKLGADIKTIGVGKISTISGRFFAMDRDGHWDRIARAYHAMTKGKGVLEESPLHAVSEAYKKGFTDNMIPPTIIKLVNENRVDPNQFIKNNDAVIFFDFRADRARQLTSSFVDSSFRPIWCFKKPKTKFVTMTLYQENLPTSIICPPERIKNSLAEILSNHKLKQFRVAESEKYAHVTYFFNGGREQAFPYEDRLIISSPRVDSFDKTPEMKADEIAHAIVDRIKKYDLIVANISNVDMVGHTGNITAVADAIKATDAAVEKIAASVLDANGGMILTADHGNAEQMVHLESEGDPETIHTLNPVPFIYVTNKDKKTNQTLVSELNSRGILKDIMMTKFTLADIAPTILDILGIKLPKEMTGQSLVKYLK